MGAESYSHKIPFTEDPDEALFEAKDELMASGKYDDYESAEEATGTLLDVEGVSDTPEFGYAYHLSEDEVEKIFGTAKPTVAAVEATQSYFDGLGRGDCRFFTIYSSDGEPKSYFFYGLTFD